MVDQKIIVFVNYAAGIGLVEAHRAIGRRIEAETGKPRQGTGGVHKGAVVHPQATEGHQGFGLGQGPAGQAGDQFSGRDRPGGQKAGRFGESAVLGGRGPKRGAKDAGQQAGRSFTYSDPLSSKRSSRKKDSPVSGSWVKSSNPVNPILDRGSILK